MANIISKLPACMNVVAPSHLLPWIYVALVACITVRLSYIYTKKDRMDRILHVRQACKQSFADSLALATQEGASSSSSRDRCARYTISKSIQAFQEARGEATLVFILSLFVGVCDVYFRRAHNAVKNRMASFATYVDIQHNTTRRAETGW
jgi:hypothetical protein